MTWFSWFIGFGTKGYPGHAWVVLAGFLKENGLDEEACKALFLEGVKLVSISRKCKPYVDLPNTAPTDEVYMTTAD